MTSEFREKRLLFESASMRKQDLFAEYGFTAYPEGGNLEVWTGILTGLQGTIWEGARLQLRLTFPSEYPFKAPEVRVTNPNVFHPNIAEDSGHVCVDILNDHWTADKNITSALRAVQGLLTCPNAPNGYGNKARRLYESDREKYEQEVRKFVEQTKKEYGEDEEEDEDE
jgi:ubiquitin-protein ligase